MRARDMFCVLWNESLQLSCETTHVARNVHSRTRNHHHVTAPLLVTYMYVTSLDVISEAARKKKMPPRALLLAYGLLVASAAALQAASTFSILDRARTEVLELVGPATVAAPPAVGGVDPDEGCAVIDDRTPE